MSISALLSNPYGDIYHGRYQKIPSNAGDINLQWSMKMDSMCEEQAEVKKILPPIYYAKNLMPNFDEEESISAMTAKEATGEYPLSEDMINQLFVDLGEGEKSKIGYTRVTFQSNDPKKLDKVFYTWYTPEGIKCIREGERNFENPEEKIGEDKLQWEIKFDSPEQYDKLQAFLAQFPEEDNLRFTTKETFWKDFFADEIDMNGFLDFYAWTDGGEPNMGIGENGESVSLNKKRIKDPNAEYFNDQTWIGQVWTEEEMWAMWYARAEASGAGHKVEDAIPVGGTVTGKNQIVFAGALESENRYFRYADERGVIDYNGIIFYCDAKTDTLKLGDCSNVSDCIQISLAEGGFLLVNRNNLNQLFDALSFFSPEDMVRILQVLQKEKMSENSLMGMEQEDDKILELVKDKNTEKRKTARDYREQAFEQVGVNAPEEVKQAWLDAADIAGIDGMGISDIGALDHIPQFLIQRWIKGVKGEDIYDVLGSTVQSAIKAANDALYALNHPLESNQARTAEIIRNREKEKAFYEEFLKRLEIL